jgi:hypothetical protein
MTLTFHSHWDDSNMASIHDRGEYLAEKEGAVVAYLECEDAPYVYKRYLTYKTKDYAVEPIHSPMTDYTTRTVGGPKAIHIFCDEQEPLAGYVKLFTK